LLAYKRPGKSKVKQVGARLEIASKKAFLGAFSGLRDVASFVDLHGFDDGVALAER
jgi:hypothetical protein